VGVVPGLFRSRTGVWVRDAEHGVLRVVSLIFSLASASAIRWFFSWLDGADRFQPVIGWAVALGFGVAGFFVSRGLAHRLMNKERVWLYLPVCLLVEFVEVVCNFGLAASMIERVTWLSMAPMAQRGVLEVLTYVVLSIVPLMGLSLAVVDMDLLRQRVAASGGGGQAGRGGAGGVAPLKPVPKSPPSSSYASGNGATYGGGTTSGGNGAGVGAGGKYVGGGGNGATYGTGYSGANAGGSAQTIPFAGQTR
jgi:hypothetical protein